MELVRSPDPFRVSPRPAQLAKVVQEAVEMLLPRAAARGIAIHTRLEAEEGVIPVDASRVIEALANVIDNALKFSPRGSTVDVVVSGASGGAQIRIEDEGPGIAPGQREMIFDRFTRAAAGVPEGNLGIGLSIARDIVEQHGGKIWAEARSPKGTRIVLEIPRSTTGVPIPPVLALEEERR
jgi:signal transduction histidine kinase